MESKKELIKTIDSLSTDEKKEVLSYLRKYINIHPIERDWNISAEVILEAINRSSDLTQRGVKGIIAEAAFKFEILEKMKGIEILEFEGNEPYDYKVKDKMGEIKIQVKLQRKKEGRPMLANEGYKRLSSNKYVVETQKTRGGKDKTKQDTRPYRFGEFDILAVSMQPSTNKWNSYMFTVSNWLIKREDNSKLILKFQPVSKTSNNDWTDDLQECIKRFRKGVKKTINS
ncbi:MAG: hypothetical protein A2057_13110 [Ignavibacteria bacterium GWA2_35_9]|nr:MAG: hypothetical protein A2057_13110 [Ignavibacteria bacterium GWA2_35_9]OGU43053.1 MAG: hypothetical protein A2000_03155 [Ignavibacteria bacterium GWB2_36_8]OGU52236.1 MAG: hypothetical protein A2080_08210 [Ignavibacteria bacterium GWC2_36_12]OGV03509.1 MAG: hypothetical protein A2330_09235 [Ignavibacteria bacterium RIFOXYB2_FULL_36_7]